MSSKKLKIQRGCGVVDYSDGIRILDHNLEEVVMWTDKELETMDDARTASEEAIKMVTLCRVDDIKKMVGWKSKNRRRK